MKVVIYRPLDVNESSIVKKTLQLSHQNMESVHTFSDLLNKIKTGDYEAVYAARPETYGKSRVQYHELMNVAIDNETKVFETYSSTELTAPFKRERNISSSRYEFAVIKRYIERKSHT